MTCAAWGDFVLRSFRRTSWFLALMGIFVIGNLAPAQAAQILIVDGSDSIAQTAGTKLKSELETAGNTVTKVDTGVPGTLTGYTQIYDLRYNNLPAFTSEEQAQYLAFLTTASNNTIFLMGENNSFNQRNDPILQFVTLAGGGTIVHPTAQSSVSETVASLFTTPNNITNVKFAACGLVTSTGTGAFATSESGGTKGCSLFFGLGALANAPNAALVVVFDVNFIYDAESRSSSTPATNEISFRQNMEAFVSAPPVAPPPTPVPTLPEWGMILLASGLVVVGVRKLRIRTTTGIA
jgi:hypothetical protein